LAGARELAAALSTLALHGDGVPIRGTALIAAQSVELALKSYLLSQGWPQKKVEKVGHNLTKAWAAAAGAGLSIDPEPPAWGQLLQSMHDDPYFLRYPPVNSGLVSPNARELQTRVDSLIELVAAAHHAA
jgi:hypothetical protein